MPDIFAALLPVKWREITFPVANFRVQLAQDLVEHKYADRDGAHVEATGRAPLMFMARAMFRNGILPGPNESFGGSLYPDVWRKFYAAATDRTIAILQHPELGGISCRLRSADTVWDAQARDGVDVDVTWIESTQDDLVLRGALASASPISNAVQAAEAADAALDDAAKALLEKLRDPGDDSISISDAINKVQSVVDQTTLFNRRLAGKIDSVVYKAQSLIDSATRVTDWPMKRSAERLVAALGDVKKTLFVNGKTVLTYTVRVNTTLAGVAASLQRTTNDLLVLNPLLARSPTVRAGTVVRYPA